MTIINANTKKGADFIAKASRNEGTELYNIYGRFSKEKAEAMEHCKELCKKENGANFRIISHSLHCFSVAWDVADGVRIETAYNSYFVKY